MGLCIADPNSTLGPCPKPHLKRKFYPKLGQGFWQVSSRPKRMHGKHVEEIRTRWAAAHRWASTRNQEL